MTIQKNLGRHILLISSALLMTAVMSDVSAQNMEPLTGKLLSEPVATSSYVSTDVSTDVSTTAPLVAATTPVAAAPAQPQEQQASTELETRIRVGDVTHTLLQAQADGRVAGPRLPMLGVTATASWQRYLDSFQHPLPEFFKVNVSKSDSSSN
ncbi:DUF3613 domain-containing protein [Glaciimonas soli]|uniref:DUF3613 domain-containing protein n=1 Tax=Glaciimonas soli TaxID=2590999 RepID=A0A843YTR4_9BURK|nr:DUF3613 domain-containing protein [Glaciimonas soli]MQR01397.1 DUF3613 domain-containing protein [Glaciimonas soli]